MANYDWNWWFGPHSIIGRILGVHSKPQPTTTPTPVPVVVPVPAPVSVTPQPTPVPVPVTPVAKTWTKAQLCDLQGDLMIFAPEISAPVGVNVNGARGLAAGYHWCLYLAWETPENRQKLYAKVRDDYKWTHLAIQVAALVPGSKGYHDLQDPFTPEFCAGYGTLMNAIHQEILDAGLIPVVAGPAPGPAEQGGAPLAPGFDASKVLVAMSDWDNTGRAAERVKFISDTFPNAWLFYERPGSPKVASGIEKSPNIPVDANWNIDNGGQWLKNLVSLCPRFVGVLYEVNNWPGDQGPDGCAAEIQLAHDGFWRDVQEVLFETNTYDKFWQGRDLAVYDALEVQLRAKVPYTKGYMSGGPAHPVMVEAPPVVGTAAGELDPSTVQWVGGPDIGSFAQTTKVTGLNLSLNGFEMLFDKKDGPTRWPDNITPGWDGPLQFSVGVCCNINGQWVGSAPIESWYGQEHGKPGIGGPVSAQNVDNSGKGQFAKNWFYNATWGPLNGYNPKPGEVIGVFVVAGDCRNNFNPVKERSNIVLMAMPGDGQSASFSF